MLKTKATTKATTTKATTTKATTTTTTKRRPKIRARTSKPSIGKTIDAADRHRILSTLTTWAASKSFLALRTRAFVLLTWGSALRVSEACALDVSQILERVSDSELHIRSTAYLRAEQSKGGYGSGAFAITKAARGALREYLLEGFARGWLDVHAPLFVGVKGRRGKSGHRRLSKRTAQHAWDELQRRARVAQHYRVHDLRHDAITRFAEVSQGHVFQVKIYGRFNDVRTAARYVHTSPQKLSELSELASRTLG